jgi:uncharacterized protein YdeI (YjbR/CyaY-like superfamily)
MGTRDPRIDAYIEQSPAFARPVLRHLRELVHRGCPDCVETIKWGSPHFDHHGILAGMAAFQQHVAFGFWKGALVFETGKEKDAMGQFGRIASLADLPPDELLVGYVRVAAKLNETGVKARPAPKHPKPPLRVPPDLKAALARNAKARKTFEGFPPSHRREYLDWITEAKRPETRAKRLAQTVEWLAEGKARNWRYMEKTAKRMQR